MKHQNLHISWYDYGARFYDAALGRFIGIDPIIEQFPHLTPYNYAASSPIVNIDMWGLQPWNVNWRTEMSIYNSRRVANGQAPAYSESTINYIAEADSKGAMMGAEIVGGLTPLDAVIDIKDTYVAARDGNWGDFALGLAAIAGADILKDGKKLANLGESISETGDVARKADRVSLGPNETPSRVQGPWTKGDLDRAAEGKGPIDLAPQKNAAGKDMPLEVHHGDQMPGSGVHEVKPAHSNYVEHPNKYNQGVTPEMRKQDAQMHWWYRGQEMGNQ